VAVNNAVQFDICLSEQVFGEKAAGKSGNTG
jgi:hypothetical protein